jgi:AraC family transcriptional regulator
VADFTKDNIICLRHKPVINVLGLYVHGYKKTESFIIPEYWQLHVYRYNGMIKIEDVEYPFRPGMASLIPPNTLVEWHFPSSAPHYVVHFGVKSSRSENYAAPILLDLKKKYAMVCEQFEEMIKFYEFHSLRAEVKLWELLLNLICEGSTGSVLATQPILGVATQYIINNIREKLVVSEIAKQIHISHSFLTNIFKKNLNCTVAEYIRRQRVKKALYLLYRSSLTIKLIAIEVGIPDLQHFNKTIRTELGSSPRKIRENWLKTNEAIKYE